MHQGAALKPHRLQSSGCMPLCLLCSAPPLPRLQDRVPNVKFNAAKILQQLAALSDPPAVSQTIRPCLAELSADKDGDVRFFAQHALAVCRP